MEPLKDSVFYISAGIGCFYLSSTIFKLGVEIFLATINKLSHYKKNKEFFWTIIKHAKKLDKLPKEKWEKIDIFLKEL